jgi:hypothetical protein
MAFYDSSDALYGTGVYGSPLYGVVTPNVALVGVSSTVTVASVAVTGFEIDISEAIDSVSAAVSVGTLQVNITESIASVSATVSIGTLEAKTTEAINSVSATTSLGSIQVNVTEILTGVSATFAVNDNWNIRSVKTVPVLGVVGTTTVNDVFNFVVTIGPISSVSASAILGTLIEVDTSEALESVSATVSIGTITATGIQFDFEAVKELYDRRRTAYVEKQQPRIVYVARQSTAAERRAAA